MWGRTREVPAAPCGGAPSPALLKLGQGPLLHLRVCERVGREVTDLQHGILTQEIRKGHPEDKNKNGMT